MAEGLFLEIPMAARSTQTIGTHRGLAGPGSTGPSDPFDRLRDESPVHRNPDGSFFVTRHDDVASVLSGRAMSSDKRGPLSGVFGPDAPIYEHHANVMVFLDPPDHPRVRGLVAHAFRNRTLSTWQPKVERVVDDLLGESPTGGEMDLIADFAYLLPLTVVGEMLGVPTDDRQRFKTWGAAVTASLEPNPSQEVIDGANAAVDGFKGYQHVGDITNEDQQITRIEDLQWPHRADVALTANQVRQEHPRQMPQTCVLDGDPHR